MPTDLGQVTLAKTRVITSVTFIPVPGTTQLTARFEAVDEYRTQDGTLVSSAPVPTATATNDQLLAIPNALATIAAVKTFGYSLFN